jgi:hypothetical protein
MTNKEFSPWTSNFNFDACEILESDKDWVAARKNKQQTRNVRFYKSILAELVVDQKLSLKGYKSGLEEFKAVNNYKQKELYASSTLWNFQNDFSEKICRIHADLYITKQEKVTLDHTYTQAMVLTSLAERFWNQLISFNDFSKIIDSKPRRVALVTPRVNNQVRKQQDKFKDKFFEVGESEIYELSGELVTNIYDDKEWNLLMLKIFDSSLSFEEVVETITSNIQLQTGNFSRVGLSTRKEVTAYIIAKLKESFESNSQSKLKYCA